ncbi:MAG: hypothetical protein JWP80_149 [Pseudomonas sp.]|nr:hypothetical protein [Pseudomonas sp.]
MSSPVIPHPPVPTIFPPSFLDVVDITFRTLVERVNPTISIDPHTTWLNRYQGTGTPVFDSLIEIFLGRLTLNDGERYGWFTSTNSVANTDQVAGLDPAQIHALYAQFTDALIAAYNETLTAYWEVVEASGKTRKTQFLQERSQVLQLEALAGVEQRALTATQGAMLQIMLRYSQDQSPDPLQKHGLYSLSLSWPKQPPMALAGCFVVSHVFSMGQPTVSDTRLGPVVLYTPNSGVEGFASFPALNESLSQRLADPVSKQWLLRNTEHVNAAKVGDVAVQGESRIAHEWNYIPMGGNFLSVQFIRQLTKQQSDFARCVELARTQKLDQQRFLASLEEMLDPRYQFDNYLNLDRNERTVIHAGMPDWWPAMSIARRSDWLASAKTYTGSIIELQMTTEAQRKKPELDSRAVIETYVDDTLNALLSSKKITLPPDQLFVDIAHYSWPLPPLYPSAISPPALDNPLIKRYSLKRLAYEKADTLMLGSAQSIVVSDVNNAPIPQLNAQDIKTLVEQLDVDGAFDRFLTAHLKTSAYGQTLRSHSDQLTLAQLRMALQVARHEGFEPVGLDWISAVLESPKASSRRSVKSATSVAPEPIHARFLTINDTPLSNVILVAPTSGTERTAIVVCTLSAPDGIVFRWFSSTDEFRRGVLNNRAFVEYLLLQMPIAQRPGALTSLEADLWLRHYRLPTVFRHLPTVVPIPALLWELERYTEPSVDFLVDNHRIKIEHLIADAKRYWQRSREQPDADSSVSAHLAISVALLFLPTPVMIPLALGIGLYAAWEGFRKIEEHDYQGAAGELLIALGYLVPAGIGKLSLSEELASPLAAPRSAPPLVRRLGPDGKQHIGFLMSPGVAPRFGPPGSQVLLNPAQFSLVTVDDEAFYVGKNFNLFGHSRLYRKSVINPSVLVHTGEYGLRGRNGLWAKAAYRPRGTGPHIFRQATRELDALTQDWPTSSSALSLAEKARFESDFMHLASTSNTAFMPEVLSYCEAGSADINQLLRAGISNAITRSFLRQLYRLNDYQGMAFRVTHVSTAGLQRLKSALGLGFTDAGVQSASVSRFNAVEWSGERFITQHATPDNELVFMIFDKSIPKKNLFCHLLGDHVGVPPGTPMQLTATKEVGEKSFFYFTSPQDLDNELYDVYSGEQEILV